jgi:TP901 family phage tail tape measure protein
VAEDLEWNAEVNDKASDVLEQIQGEVQDTSTATGEMAGQTSTAAKAISKVRGVAGGAAKALGGLAAAGAATATAIGVKSVQAASDFSASISEATAKVDASQQTLKQFEQAAIEAGAESAHSATKAGDALGFLAQAGFDANESVEALPQTLQLATAGNLEVANAADIASNVLTGMSLEVEELTRVSDVLVKTQADTNTSTQQLGQAFAEVAPQAEAVGMTLEQTSAIIGRLGNAGIQGSKAGTALKNAMAQIQMPSSRAESALKNLGISLQTASGEARGLIPILRDLERQEASSAQMTKIFGREAGPAMQALLAQGIDGLRDFEGELQNVQGTSEEMADFMNQSLAGQFNILQGSIDTLLITIGQQFAPVMKSLAERTTELTNTLRGNQKMMKRLQRGFIDLVDLMGAMARAAVPVVKVLGEIGRQSNNVLKGLQTIGEAGAYTWNKYHEQLAETAGMTEKSVEFQNAAAEAQNKILEINERREKQNSTLTEIQQKLNSSLYDTSKFLDDVANGARQTADDQQSLVQKERELRDALESGNQELGTRLEKQRKLHRVQQKQKLEEKRAKLGQLKTNIGAMSGEQRQRMRQQIIGLKGEIATLESQVRQTAPSGDSGGSGGDGPSPDPTPDPSSDPAGSQGPSQAELDRREQIGDIQEKINRAERRGRKEKIAKLEAQKELVPLNQEASDILEDGVEGRQERIRLQEIQNKQTKVQRDLEQELAKIRSSEKEAATQRRVNRMLERATKLRQQGKRTRAVVLKFQAQKQKLEARELSDAERSKRLAELRLRLQQQLARAKKDGAEAEKVAAEESKKVAKQQGQVFQKIQSGVRTADQLSGQLLEAAGASDKLQSGASTAMSAIDSGVQAAQQFAKGNIFGGIMSSIQGIGGLVSDLIGQGSSKEARQKKQIKNLREQVRTFRNQRRTRAEMREDVKAGNLAALREANRESLRPVNVVFQGNTFMERSERVQRRVDQAQQDGRRSRL